MFQQLMKPLSASRLASTTPGRSKVQISASSMSRCLIRSVYWCSNDG